MSPFLFAIFIIKFIYCERGQKQSQLIPANNLSLESSKQPLDGWVDKINPSGFSSKNKTNNELIFSDILSPKSHIPKQGVPVERFSHISKIRENLTLPCFSRNLRLFPSQTNNFPVYWFREEFLLKNASYATRLIMIFYY